MEGFEAPLIETKKDSSAALTIAAILVPFFLATARKRASKASDTFKEIVFMKITPLLQ
jgi:hypothetical protein